MTAQVIRFTTDPRAAARLAMSQRVHLDELERTAERERFARAKAEQAEAVAAGRAILRSPVQHSDQVIREACAALETWGDGMDWQIAAVAIHALNRRIRERAHAEARMAAERPRDVFRRYRADWPVICTAALFVAGLAWLFFALAPGGFQ